MLIFFPLERYLTPHPYLATMFTPEKLLREGSAASSSPSPSGRCPSRKGSLVSRGGGVVSSPASGASLHQLPCPAAPGKSEGSASSRVQTEYSFLQGNSPVWPEILLWYPDPNVGADSGSPKTSSWGLSHGTWKGKPSLEMVFQVRNRPRL